MIREYCSCCAAAACSKGSLGFHPILSKQCAGTEQIQNSARKGAFLPLTKTFTPVAV